jgi:hypothetical protein
MFKDHSSSLYLRLRFETVREMYVSEKSHVLGLETIKKTFLDPLRASGLLTEDSIRGVSMTTFETVLEVQYQ